MVSTRRGGSPIVMLDDHEQLIRQPSSPTKRSPRKQTGEKLQSPAKASASQKPKASKKSKKVSKQANTEPASEQTETDPIEEYVEEQAGQTATQEPPKEQPASKAENKRRRSTRRNPVADDEIEFLSEPELLLQKPRPGKKQQVAQPPSFAPTSSERDLYDPPSEDGGVQTVSESTMKFKSKGKNVVLKVPKAAGTVSTAEVGPEQRPKMKKRRRDIGTYYGDYEDDSEVDERALLNMTLKEFEDKFKSRANAAGQEITNTSLNINDEFKSMTRRLRAVQTVISKTVHGFNDTGVYDRCFRENDGLSSAAVLPGDPFPVGATNFDPDHPGVKALFPKEKLAEEANVLGEHLSHVEGALGAAQKLHRITELMWLQTRNFKAILEQEKWFLEKCRNQAMNGEADYGMWRGLQSEEDREAKERRRKIEERGKGREKGKERGRPTFAVPALPNRGRGARGSRKRAADSSDNMSAKRRRMDRTFDSDSSGTEGFPTPPPVDRVVVEMFGNHTPGRERRIHRGANSPGVGGPSGIHDDNAPWTSEENDALDHALEQVTVRRGRWDTIKSHFGGVGTALAERSVQEIREKALEYKVRIENSGQELPGYWKDIGYSSGEEEEGGQV
ncbi:hypothetical protein TWF730_005227 [Orbilia blumenaviensis]|uniref:Myb-like domain-containing protein n=1 Tax=Orbilia blumenaviensis TaxID=1796055 RepID=A0AAV9VI47_9PEZI